MGHPLGKIRAVVGEPYMLTEQEELWEKELTASPSYLDLKHAVPAPVLFVWRFN